MLADETLRHSEIVSVRDAIHDALVEARFTTSELVAVEERLLGWARSVQGAGRGLVPAGVVEGLIARRGLAGEQAALVRAVCSSGDGVSVVIGAPGAGKTWALAAAREAWEAFGFRVIGCALAGRAADELEAGSGIASQTIDSLLADLDRRDTGGLAPGACVVVDEAGVCDTRRLAGIAQHASAGGKLVLIGDDRQLPAVGAGGALTGLADRLGAARLTGNRRQRDIWERDAITALREGRTGEAVGAYLREGRVVVADDAADLARAIVDRWSAATRAGVEVVMLARTRDATRLLNALARACLRADDLPGRELVAGADGHQRLGERAFAVGDQVVCLRNRRLPGGPVRNGTLATVVSVNEAGLVVRTAAGVELRLPRTYVEGFVDHGWAMTVHKTQGRTIGSPDGRRAGLALVWGAESLAAEAALVAASRATDRTELYVLATPEPFPTAHDPPAGVTPAAALERGWSRDDGEQLAADRRENEALIRRLAASVPRSHLAARRDQLDVLVSVPPDGAEAERRLASAAAVVDELWDREAVAAPQEARSIADRRRGIEAEGALAVAEVHAHDVAARRHEGLLAEYGTDVRAHRSERELLERALATQRRWRLDAIAADPPAHVTDLLGPRPSDRRRALRWLSGVSLIEDLRNERGLVGDPTGATAWGRAFGTGPMVPGSAPHAGALRQLVEIRRDLGLAGPAAGPRFRRDGRERPRPPAPPVTRSRAAQGRSR
jgi:hypothetical protein